MSSLQPEGNPGWPDWTPPANRWTRKDGTLRVTKAHMEEWHGPVHVNHAANMKNAPMTVEQHVQELQTYYQGY